MKPSQVTYHKFMFVALQLFWSGGKKNSNGKFVFEIDDIELVYDQENIPFGGNYKVLEN